MTHRTKKGTKGQTSQVIDMQLCRLSITWYGIGCRKRTLTFRSFVSGFATLNFTVYYGPPPSVPKIPASPDFFLGFLPESRFSPCSLRNIEYCCVISPYSPLLSPLFPTLFRTPTSRPFLSLLSYPSHPFFVRTPTP